MIRDLRPYRVARDMIEDYGSCSAGAEATARADAMAVIGNQNGRHTWIVVAQAIEQIRAAGDD